MNCLSLNLGIIINVFSGDVCLLVPLPPGVMWGEQINSHAKMRVTDS